MKINFGGGFFDAVFGFWFLVFEVVFAQYCTG